MKKITFLVASVLITSGIVNATEYRTNCNFEVPISFMERGIEFFVFPNGEFDFNTRPLDSEGDYFYKTAGKRGNSQERRTMNYGTRIEHDSFGRVRRIGNTFINYDSRDRVNRIGSVYMRYTRFALCQIGNMRIVYNYRGEIVDTVGCIKGYNSSGYAYNYNNHYFDDNYTASSYNDNNSDYYYYKADGTKAKVEDDKERK